MFGMRKLLQVSEEDFTEAGFFGLRQMDTFYPRGLVVCHWTRKSRWEWEDQTLWRSLMSSSFFLLPTIASSLSFEGISWASSSLYCQDSFSLYFGHILRPISPRISRNHLLLELRSDHAPRRSSGWHLWLFPKIELLWTLKTKDDCDDLLPSSSEALGNKLVKKSFAQLMENT